MANKACIRKETNRIMGESIGEMWDDTWPVLVIVGIIIMFVVAIVVWAFCFVHFPAPTVVVTIVGGVVLVACGFYLDARARAVLICERREREKNQR